MADTMTIITNHVPRLVIDAYELTEAERKEFDYIDWHAVENGETSPTFVRYKGELIDLGDLDSSAPGSQVASMFPGWDGYRSDSFFSGIVVKYYREPGTTNRDGDQAIDWDRIIVGRYYS